MTGFWKRRNALPIIIFFGTLIFLFFMPVLSGRWSFPSGDFNTLYLPYNVFFRNELAARHLPVWNPYVYSGHPFLADPQAAVFYPINDLFTLVSLPWAGWAERLYWLQLEAIFHFLLAGIFTWVLVTRLTHDRMAGVMAGTTFVFSGYLTGYPALQLTILRTPIWLPLLLWLLFRSIADDGRGWRWWMFFAVTYAIAFLAGHPQTFIYLSYVTLSWGVFLTVERVRRSKNRWNTFGQLILRSAVALGISLGLVAIQLIPGIELARLSVRANVSYDFLSGGATTQDFWQFVLPSVWSPFSPLYVGVIAVGLAGIAVLAGLAAIFVNPKFKQKSAHMTTITLFFAVVAVIALLVSMGRNGPLYPLFYHFAPGWKLFRNQERAAYLVAFSLSVLGGMGVAWLRLLPSSYRRWLGWIIAGVLLAGIVAFFLVWRIPLRLALADRWFSITILLSLAGIFVLAWIVEKHPLQAWALIVLSLASLFYANWDTLQTSTSVKEAAFIPAPIAGVQEAAQACVNNTRCIASWQGKPGRIFNETHVANGFGPILTLEEVWGTSPLRLKRYGALFENFPLDRMWQLTGVQYVLTWRAELFEPGTLLNSYQQADETIFLYRLNEPNPRAWFVDNVKVMPDQEAIKAIAAYEVEVESQAILSPEAAEHIPDIPPSIQTAPFLVRRLAANRLQLHIPNGPGGLLILSENWMPGWKALRVQDAHGVAKKEWLPLVRADVTFLGISIPPGGGVIEVWYQPASLKLGLSITMITLMALAIIALASLLKRTAH